MTKRLALVAHYDPRGQAAPHVLRQLDELSSLFDEVVLATTVDLTPEAASAISSRATLMKRANYGHDFGSWRDCLEQNDWAQGYDELLLTNDSYVGYFRPLGDIIETMNERPAEFWGITQSARHAPHIQSYFLHFTSPALRSQAFRSFWTDSKPAPSRESAIYLQEVGISRAMMAAGYRFDTYFTPTREERLRATRRGVHWLRTRRQKFPARFDSLADGYFDARRHRDPAQADNLNWSSALADSTLDGGRLPLIKLDTLRYDPYWLGAGELLDDLEKAYPDKMEGVRQFIIETAPFYGRREYSNYGFARLNPVEQRMYGYRAHRSVSQKGRNQ